MAATKLLLTTGVVYLQGGALTISGPLTVSTGPLTITSGQFLAANGTAAAPGFAFASETRAGMWTDGSDVFIGTGTGTSGSIGIYTRGTLNWVINNGLISDQGGNGISPRYVQFSGASSAYLRGGSGDGLLNIVNAANTIGFGLDAATDAIMKVRTRAHSGYATVDALGYKVSGAAGASFGPGLPTSITVVNGLITAIS